MVYYLVYHIETLYIYICEFYVYLHVDSQKHGSLGVKNPLDLRMRTLQPLAKARGFHGAMEVT